eukprot:269840-Rhodomonas_salina.1
MRGKIRRCTGTTGVSGLDGRLSRTDCQWLRLVCSTLYCGASGGKPKDQPEALKLKLDDEKSCRPTRRYPGTR